ncbi:MAG: hypothetical protein VX078_21835, partial [Pseudomonadota bacterium]|nr:hypothetical protein [Pseudomonadota bacterium]
SYHTIIYYYLVEGGYTSSRVGVTVNIVVNAYALIMKSLDKTLPHFLVNTIYIVNVDTLISLQ